MSFDIVTGAWSRAALQPRLSQEISRTRRAGGSCSVFLFDVDFFKTVNDVYGHLRGDAVLRQIADRVTAAMRLDDTVFRYGGDEFVVLLPDTDRQAALQLALRLTELVRSTPFEGEPPLHISISLGVATYPHDADDAISLLRAADRRNYLAKHRGRGGAVADDTDTAAAGGSSRLWERDEALSATHDFLTKLAAHGRGSLQVNGPPGAGHTRFLQEVQRLAVLRGFTVVGSGTEAQPPAEDSATPPGPVLVLADTDPGRDLAATVGRWTDAATPPQTLGVAYACVNTPVAPPAGVPLLASVDLTPWSPATQRIWLRSVLQGEPSDVLADWIARESGGLPAAAVRELARLRQRDGIESDGSGGWTVSSAVLGRPRRQVRLPAPVTGLVGREHERARVSELLRSGRLVTLVGPGGIGKTRLSLSAATDVADEFHDGVVFVPLADTNTPDEVVSAVAGALHVDEVPGQPLLEGVTEHLADANLLLVLDNLEQVVSAAPLIGQLINDAPDLVVLATSREPLSVYGEHVYRVPPLPLPDLHALPHGADGVAVALSRSPAVALFDQRARAAGGAFVLCADTLPSVAELCRLLDGLPLAIELAAARTDAMDVVDLLQDLRRHLDALGGGPADRPERQQTLRGAIDWSYELLDLDARRLFEATAVFTGGCTVPAALAVADPDSALDDAEARLKELAGRLDSLAAKSLLVCDTDPDGELRYRMLETIRAYAAARLTERDATTVRDRHRGYFLGLADAAADGMSGPQQTEWVERIDRDHANLRAAAGWSLESADPSSAGRICLGLWRYWRNGNHIGDGRQWLDRVLSADPGPTGRERAALLYPAAVLAATQDDDDSATRYGMECLTLADAAGDRQTTAQARNILGVAALRVGRFAEATEHFGFGLEVWRELGQPQGMAMALGNLAKVFLRQGQIDAAADHIQQCLALERAAGNSSGVLLGLECLGEIMLARGDSTGAREAAGEALALSRELGDVFGEAMALHQCGLAARSAGDTDEARDLFLTAMDLRHQVGDREDLAVSLDCVADLLVEVDPQRAVRLLAGADRLRQSRNLITPADDGRRDAAIAAARAALGGSAFAAAWRAGRGTALEALLPQAHGD
jgi:diguanylate cyclase (GGDEF)-like protein